ncbi:MAG: T9SS type A sorting domain-containing protein, partial [Candidatus Neomarinimicrobiota bacterium]
LHPAFPNPFNQSTTIRYEIPKETFVRIVIYNLNGEVVSKIAESSHQPGYYEARWNGMNQRGNVVSSGIYFVRMATESYLHTQKILLMK